MFSNRLPVLDSAFCTLLNIESRNPEDLLHKAHIPDNKDFDRRNRVHCTMYNLYMYTAKMGGRKRSSKAKIFWLINAELVDLFNTRWRRHYKGYVAS